jgi:endonuclease YncB( thermonuclease family)
MLGSAALAGPETLAVAGRGAVTVVGDGALVTVEGIPGTVRLAAIQIPGLAPRRKGEPSAFEQKAYAALKGLVENRQVTVHVLPVARDRGGRTLAHLIRDDGVWIEAELVRAGLALVAPTTDTEMFAADLLAIEQDARAHGRGMWADEVFAARQADAPRLAHDTASYRVVEGRVLETARRGDNIYLNFGADYRTDFTVTIPRTSLAAFAAYGIKPQDLTGQKVRVRGWITQYRGPAMELTTPAALEVLK